MKININNFRNFDNQQLNFSRVNILIGENSGGKSSLLKFLLALKQTVDSPLESNLKLRGDYTDLGNYQEVVKDRIKTKKINFGFSDTTKYFEYFLNFINKFEKEDVKIENETILDLLNQVSENKTETSIKFTLSSLLNNHKSISTVITNNTFGKITIHSKKIDLYDTQRELSSTIVVKFNNLELELQNCLTYKEGFFTLFDSELRKKIFSLDIENKNEVFYKIIFLLIFQNYCMEYIETIRFVNPIGNSPRRLYFQEDKKSNYRLIDIEKFINILGDPGLSQREFNKKIAFLNEVIQKSGIAEEVQIVKNKDLPVLALNVKTKGFWANITDVGYGVSLQLPILFQAILSEKFTSNIETLLIEQPEVHLHPSLQSKFIDTLLSIGNKNRYFIETHSEHIIRKLQILIKNKEYNLKPEDITIHYFKRTENKFEITNHQIDINGKLNPPFPTGFYDNSYNLVKELL
jgi:predicted ATPase